MLKRFMLMAAENGVGFDLEVISGPQFFAIVTFVGLVAAIWVYVDARRQGISNPAIWAVAIAFLFFLYAFPGIIALIVYLFVRSSDPDKTEALNSESGENQLNR